MATTLGIITPDNTTPKTGDLTETLKNRGSSGNTTTVNDSVFSREDVSQLMFDILKNTSINGVYPTVAGGNIDYPLSTEFKASDEWAKQNWYSQPMSTPTNTAPTNFDSTNVPAAIVRAISNSGIVSGDAGQNTQKSAFNQAESKAIALADSNVQVAKSSSTVADSNVDVAKSSSTVANSNVDIAKSGPTAISDSKLAASNSRLPFFSDAERDVADPVSNSLNRRRSNESASQPSAQTPMLCTKGNKGNAYLVYTHDSHSVALDVESMADDSDYISEASGTTLSEDDYYVSGIPVDFYCYKDGKIGKITLSAAAKFKELGA